MGNNKNYLLFFLNIMFAIKNNFYNKFYLYI